jgi:hypothetical protein
LNDPQLAHYFKYQTPSNLRLIQFLNVRFRGKNQKGARSSNLKRNSIFQQEKFEVILYNVLRILTTIQNGRKVSNFRTWIANVTFA